MGHNYMGHNYMGHNYMGHNYMGHNYMGHNYMGHRHAEDTGPPKNCEECDKNLGSGARARGVASARGWTARCSTSKSTLYGPTRNYISHNYMGHNYIGHRHAEVDAAWPHPPVRPCVRACDSSSVLGGGPVSACV